MLATILMTYVISFTPSTIGQEDIDGISSEDILIDDDAQKRYFLIPPKIDPDDNKKRRTLLLVLPGGNGSADFHPFIKRIFKNAVDENTVVAHLVAPRWNEDQAENAVWPTQKHRGKIKEMRFTTEMLIEEVIENVARRFKLDPTRIYTLGWSSSGPACYATSLTPKSRVRGSLIAMSVFKKDMLPSLKRARGHAYFLLHSPDDWIPISHAENARDTLKKHGAKTELLTYSGGHGWKGDVYGNIRKGLEWLEKSTGK